eukprot:jgi/Botrbrau1/3639/Bobra.0204s0030.1
MNIPYEFHSAQREDARRQAVDQAKKRAVEQKSDYHTFQNMVAAAHLKPVTASTSAGKQIFLRAFDASGCPVHGRVDNRECSNIRTGDLPRGCCQSYTPQSQAEFIHYWRKADISSRLVLLHDKHQLAHRWFSVELPPNVFKEVLITLGTWWRLSMETHEKCTINQSIPNSPPRIASGALTPSEESNLEGAVPPWASRRQAAERILHILQTLAGQKRFSLSLRLIGQQHGEEARALVREVCELLASESGLDACAAELKSCFQCDVHPSTASQAQ